MPYDQTLAERVRTVLGRRKGITEKKMFGGVGFLLNGNMSVAIWKQSLIVRLGPEQAELALREAHVKEFDITGKAMRGWAMIGPGGLEGDDDVRRWCERSLRFVRTLPGK
ncbi:MAG: TfoX/Sxy family protein [Planctomycetaceae bacterium]